MNKLALMLSLVMSMGAWARAQELFPNTEPASNIPSGVLGFRLMTEFYGEIGEIRRWQALRCMYGLNAEWMVSGTISFSNHHGTTLPGTFISNDGTLGTHTHGSLKGVPYPVLFETFNLNVKYRFLVLDGRNTHFRAAAWGEVALGNEAHDEGEPSLAGDNSGYSAGLIFTQLYHRVALSAGLTGIFPTMYRERSTDIMVRYGNAFEYSLSVGYLLFPLTYESYNQINVNLYAELFGKAYSEGGVTAQGKEVIISRDPPMLPGRYVEVRPAIQFLFWSNTRLDISPSFLVSGRTYTKFFPVWRFNLQYYFYL
jgi:hypothetical protein